MYSVHLLLDTAAGRAVRAVRAALGERGVAATGDDPHVTLVAFADCDEPAVQAALDPLRVGAAGVPLALEAVGFFLTDEAPAFLGVTPSERLLALHREVHDAVRPYVSGIGPYFVPGALVPHCTLAFGADRGALLAALPAGALPIAATAAGLRLVRH